MKRIIFLASNNLQNDPRVQREASGAGKNGLDSIALGFYWIAPGSELPEREKMNGYEIQRVLYRPGTVLKEHKNAFTIIIGIFGHLLLIWFWFLTYRRIRKCRQDIEVGQFGVSKKSVATVSSSSSTPLWRKIIILPYGFYCRLRQLFGVWLGTFDYYASMTIALADKGIKLRPTIVHANDLDTLWAGYLIKRQTGAKLVYDAHEFWLDMGLRVPRPFILAFKLSEKYLLGKIDGFVTVNEPIIKKIENFYTHKFRVPAIAVYNCPCYQPVKLSRKAGENSQIKILYQGRFAFNRGLEQLTEAMKGLPANVTLYFRAIKDIEMEDILKGIVQGHALTGRVKFLPAVAMDQMVLSARGYDIGVVPYVPVHADNELCSPNKLFEYMMAGLALAVSDLPVLRAIVKKYNNGVMFNPRDPDDIAKALKRLIVSRRRMRLMQQNSLKAAANPFCWEKQQEKLNNLYGEILSR